MFFTNLSKVIHDVRECYPAPLFTHRGQTISKAVDLYCRSIEDLFMTEMFPRPTDYVQPQKTSAWLEKARQLALSGEKKPYNAL
jgi:hypothetical protein